MLRVGLTGGLGSGKSTVGRMFAALGVHLIEADEIGRRLMQPGESVYSEIVRRFGHEVVREDGTLDRQALARLTFEGGRLEELNHIVHPAVIQEQAVWMEAVFASEPNAVAMVESALIFEAERSGTVPGWRHRFDRIVLVTAPDALKIDRYVQRLAGGATLSAEQIAAARRDATTRLAAQIPDSVKAPLCDYVLENTGTLEALRPAVQMIYLKLREEAARLTA